MPRISAATVADHRANQHAALLEAAREILAAEGVHALTPAAVGARIGLARSSVYRYFASTADILAQLVEDAFPRWSARLRAAIAPAGPDDSLPGRIRTYGRTALDFVGSPDYALIPALQAIGLPGECRVRVDEMHGALIAPLADALREAGADHPALRAELAWGCCGRGPAASCPTRRHTTQPHTTRPRTTRPHTTQWHTTLPHTIRGHTTRPHMPLPHTTRRHTTRRHTTRSQRPRRTTSSRSPSTCSPAPCADPRASHGPPMMSLRRIMTS
ncbi:hypothetical protein GCM10027612_72930 [Microbispora bryophytorum subsp. camponoti]